MDFKFRITHFAAAAMLATGAMAMADDVAPTALQAAVGSVTSNGYFRAGWGEAGKGGNMQCFGVGYAKFRLGNECDAYGEIGLDIPVFNQSNGAVWTAHTMVNTDIPYSADYWDTKLAFAQNYISVAHWGDGALKDAVLWAGLRYYDRPDLHMLDYKYLVGDGSGAGIENINLGNDVMFSYALMRPADSNDLGRTWLENLFKVSNIKAGPGAFTFNAGLTGAWHSDNTTVTTTDPLTGLSTTTTSATAQTSNGWYLSGLYDHPVGDLGSNRIGLQYGRGANATGNFSSINQGAASDDSTLQVFDNITLEPKDSQWTVMGHAVYRSDDYSDTTGGKRTWWAVGARPQYHFTDIFGFATELGYESYKQDNLDLGNENITKVTFALTAAAGKGAYARPELRLFYTYAKWNDAAMKDPGNPMNAVSSKGVHSVYENSTNGSSFGVQAEAWW
ncbi:carbohydrate porin [Silvimonas iriomotensis]|uniref:Maltoporin n=1 Tax=Silvimonas iriomotensis TaxID=449662 RepID=A0ABQ2PAV5_9NEIS|nr:carbohydrate porin [Silvimonas iriomotensis]GGP22546.1 maltoporin [Silvimonas iriomotensis]